ncbi:MAG: branched-chain amino acid transport system ATP-binding protein livF, partial [Actinomycetota bacterium]|nr:branched-chain amino acid transport system ATP-binding protein livF [Actinomycetota bacterium]
MLRCKDVDVSYGPVQVLFGVELEVAEGEIVALLGTNGAGKSTLLKAVTGLVKPTRGTVEFEGHDITGRPADQVTRAGVSLMPGGKGVFPTLSVEENLRLAGWLLRDDPGAVADARARVLDLFPILEQRIGEMAGNLSGGEQQMLALAQSFICRPSLLMIDELSLGLAPTVVGQLLDVVRRIHEQGTTIVLVEQSVNVALTLAQRAVFMEKGEVRFEGPTTELLDRPDILRSVFIAGANARNGKSKKPANSPSLSRYSGKTVASSLGDGPVVLECREVTKRFGGIRAVDGVDVELRKGQILGLIGQNGAGKT